MKLTLNALIVTIMVFAINGNASFGYSQKNAAKLNSCYSKYPVLAYAITDTEEAFSSRLTSIKREKSFLKALNTHQVRSCIKAIIQTVKNEKDIQDISFVESRLKHISDITAEKD
ncbi:MAG: hypothetical protein ACXWR0_04950 [Bdellovibrio sp.]